MSDKKFLRLVHAVIGFRKIDGFQYKILARELRISKQLLSQYLQGDICMPQEIKEKIIAILDLERIVKSRKNLTLTKPKFLETAENKDELENSHINQ